MTLPDLILRGIPKGSHGFDIDLRLLLYRGGTRIRRENVEQQITEGKLGEPISTRLPVVLALHEELQASLTSGKSSKSIESYYEKFRAFWNWADANDKQLTIDGVQDTFISWANDDLWHSAIVKKTHKTSSAHASAASVAARISCLLEVHHGHPVVRTQWLLDQTRIERPKGKPRQDEKVPLDDAAAMGRVLVQACLALSAELVRGTLPIVIELPGGVIRQWSARSKPLGQQKGKHRVSRAEKHTRAMGPNDCVSDHKDRTNAFNFRIESELLIFIANTGMNISQALILKREKFRWQSDEDDVLAFRVYKNRRHGEAVFRAFKQYKSWLTDYVQWLDDIGIDDERLFPFISWGLKVPPEGGRRSFSQVKAACKSVGVTFVAPKHLRLVRQNWLLRETAKGELTALAGAHAEPVLLRVYEQPSLAASGARITKFFLRENHALASSSGVCVNSDHGATPEQGIASVAPPPDCISPEGCLFCVHHRDIESLDYIWMLRSHMHLKSMERDSFELPLKADEFLHPADIVIDRIMGKLKAFEERSTQCLEWVVEAEDRILEGEYHPRWAGFIKLHDKLRAVNTIA